MMANSGEQSTEWLKLWFIRLLIVKNASLCSVTAYNGSTIAIIVARNGWEAAKLIHRVALRSRMGSSLSGYGETKEPKTSEERQRVRVMGHRYGRLWCCRGYWTTATLRGTLTAEGDDKPYPL